jgi:YggT family protein
VKEILGTLLGVYWLILFARIILSWFPPPRSPGARSVVSVIYDITDPILRPLRNLIPPVRMGAMAMDFSPIIIFIVIGVVRSAVLGCTGLVVC